MSVTVAEIIQKTSTHCFPVGLSWEISQTWLFFQKRPNHCHAKVNLASQAAGCKAKPCPDNNSFLGVRILSMKFLGTQNKSVPNKNLFVFER